MCYNPHIIRHRGGENLWKDKKEDQKQNKTKLLIRCMYVTVQWSQHSITVMKVEGY
jgi:hypothetical protein